MTQALKEAIAAELAEWTGDHRTQVKRAFDDMLERYERLSAQAPKLSFTISADAPRILTDNTGGCRPATMREIEMWDLLSAQAPAHSDEEIIGLWDSTYSSRERSFEQNVVMFARALGVKQ